MEFLSSLINKKCDESVWGKVKASRNGPSFSHIFFADDLLLFAKATQENCEAISEVLEEFCSATGQKISCEKSKVFFSPTVTMEDRANLTHQLGISETSNLGNYLGFPLRHKGKNRNEFQFVIDRVQAKLSGWESNCLSPAGRLVLLKAAVTPIVEYYMQCCKLPARVSERIDKLTRDFLWGSNDERRRIHLVGWDKVTKPTCFGGLGLFQVKARNDAILAKLCWHIALNSNAAWSQMLCKKYLTPARLNERGRKYPASHTWKACKCIKKGTEFYAIVPNFSNKPPRTQIQVKWLKPNPGWVKLNSDGVVGGALGKAGGGGVIRCNRGNWIAGFTRKLGP
nr:putative ribonuclease h protein [Quercus suber]